MVPENAFTAVVGDALKVKRSNLSLNYICIYILMGFIDPLQN